MSFNSISILPPEISQLSSLERLVIVGNQITGFPANISVLKKLKWVDCRRNSIADLSAIAKIPSLVTLRADHNSFLVLDLDIGTSLATLEASCNSITRFTLPIPNPDQPRLRPYAITQLDLSHGKLSSLDDAVLDASSVAWDSHQSHLLSCTNNDLGGLPDSIGALQKLKKLIVRNNNIKEMPVGIWYCELLEESIAARTCYKFGLILPTPTLVQNQIDIGRASAVARPLPLALSLQRLLLADNQLLDDVFHPLAVLRDLRVLNLSFNQISEMPSLKLQTFAQLEELYLSGNRLTSFPADDLERLVKLNVLFLNVNRLQTLPAELRRIAKLTSLDVGSNVLKYNMANFPFDWNWTFNRELRYLNLSGNKRLVVKPLDQEKTSVRPGDKSDKQENDFSVLRDIRVLGLIDATVMVPSVPDESDDRRVRTSLSEVNGMAYGIADTLGKLEHLNMFDLAVPSFRGRDDECLFGMFGRAAPVPNSNRLAKYLHENFSQTLIATLKSLKQDRGEEVPDALRRTFLSLNKTLYDHLLPSAAPARKIAKRQLSPGPRSSIQQVSRRAPPPVWCNRGLWDYMDAQTAVDMLWGRRKHDGHGDLRIGQIVSKTIDPAAETQAMLALRRVAQPRRNDLVSDRTLNRLGPEVAPPIGSIALVFTDIRNSTSLWEKNPLATTRITQLRRIRVQTEGDAFMVSFQSAPAAMLWCFKVQIGLCNADWPIEILESEDGKEIRSPEGDLLARGLSVRMGIHWGAPVCEESYYRAHGLLWSYG
ncbi:adenylate cyclase [Rhizoctonia solani]|uniref:Adenylate cyclase n=1 Tax=Rhizoctonia solani TaxID=456999 RepID=A0A8H8P160_9AGAM|nr:adenylate cyclase [Rhizoctonia solani]QRW21797.1 adenylate cyclase [Rhizoctonia solani]